MAKARRHQVGSAHVQSEAGGGQILKFYLKFAQSTFEQYLDFHQLERFTESKGLVLNPGREAIL